jgi:catechol-2,3-dioxygenase
MARFYGEAMGFGVDASPQALTVEAGGTRLHFEPAAEGQRPIYHVAWAIPENKLAPAKAWLAARTALLVHPDGRDEFHFRTVNRHAVYFADPAGNVLELIARHNLDDGAAGPFTLADVLYVNHAGLVVDDLPGAVRDLETGLGLGLRADPTPDFAQLGDEHRHVVLVTRKRLWLPEMKVPAAASKGYRGGRSRYRSRRPRGRPPKTAGIGAANRSGAHPPAMLPRPAPGTRVKRIRESRRREDAAGGDRRPQRQGGRQALDGSGPAILSGIAEPRSSAGVGPSVPESSRRGASRRSGPSSCSSS